MNQTPQEGYICSQAATMAVSRLEKGITKGTPQYEAVHDSYLKSFFHYVGMCSTVLVGKKRLLPNSFVEAMISYWGSCDKEERKRLTAEAIEEIMEDVPAFIAKTSRTYSQVRATGILQVSRQTIIHWMNKGWMDYILIGDARRSLKIEVDKMLEYKAPGKKKEDYTRYKGYFVQKGVWQEQVRVKKGKRVMTYEELAAKCLDLETKKSELEKKVKDAEKALEKSEKIRNELVTQIQNLKGHKTETSKNKALGGNLTAAQGKIDDLGGKVEELQQQNAKLQGEYDEALKRNKELTAQIEANRVGGKQDKNRIDGIQTQEYQKLEQQRCSLAAQLTQLESRCDDLVKENNALRKQIQFSKQKGKRDVRIYRPSETYGVGEIIEHTFWETFGKVISVSGDSIDVLFEDEGVGKKTLIQGRKLCP